MLWQRDKSSICLSQGEETSDNNVLVLEFNLEVNSVLMFHLQAICKPMAWHKFGSPDNDDDDNDGVNNDDGSYFISAVCWKTNSPTVLAANSEGKLKVLVLA